MSTDTNLQFIRQKIHQLGNAIMYSLTEDLIRFPNCIVTAVKVDQDGKLWFLCARPQHLPDQCSQSFPARLHFYRKGEFFHVQVSGKANIVNEYFGEGAEKNKTILIKMDMQNIDYTEASDNRKSRLEIWLEKFIDWVARNISISHPSKSVLHQLSNSSQ